MTKEEMIAWAKTDPHNPKAKRILQSLGGQRPDTTPPGTQEQATRDERETVGRQGRVPTANPVDPSGELSAGVLRSAVKHAAGVALPTAGAAAGAMLPVPGMAAAGGAAGNVLAGMVGRYMDNRPAVQGQGEEMAKDAAWGAAPVAATRTAGRLLSGSRNTIKAAGQLLGEETPRVAARMGPEMAGIPSRDLAGVASMGAEGTANDAMSFAGDLSKYHQKNLQGLLKQGFRNPEAINPEKIAANQLSTLADPWTAQGAISQTAGVAGGAVGHAVAGYQGFHAARTLASSLSKGFSTPEQRYLATLAEAYKRNLPLSPELEKLISNSIAPQAGQAAQAVPALTQGVREYMQRGQGE